MAFCSFFYVNNYYQGLHGYPYSLLGHTWSLGVEEQFYLLWPGVFLLFHKRPRQLKSLLLAVIPLLWVYRSILYFRGVQDSYIYTAFETRLDGILVGCLFALAWRTNLAQHLRRRFCRLPYLALTFGLLLLSQFLESRYGVAYRDIFSFSLNPIIIAVLIVQLIDSNRMMWMDSRPLAYLGRISYSTYLYQEIVLPAVGHLKLHTAASAVVSCISVWIVASFSYEFIEKPFLRLKRHEEPVPVQPAELPITGEA